MEDSITTAMVYIFRDGDVCKIVSTDGTFSQTRDFPMSEYLEAVEFAHKSAYKLQAKVVQMTVE
jgi:hypothetical protein